MTTSTKPYAILRPIPPDQAWKPEVDPTDVLLSISRSDLLTRLERMTQAEIVVIDFETKGTRAWHPDDRPVGVGCAWHNVDGSTEAFYLPIRPETRRADQWYVVNALSRCNLVAFNVLFDSQFLVRWAADVKWRRPEPAAEGAGEGEEGSTFPWRFVRCAYFLYKALSTEDFEGQSWSLKSAQVDMLGWSESNEAGIDGWLIEHGYVRGLQQRKEEPLEEYVARVRARLAEWAAFDRGAGARPSGSRPGPDKGEMWRVPPEIIGSYCVLDCLSTLQLHDLLREQTLTRFPELHDFHEGPWMTLLMLLAEQVRVGIRLDADVLRRRADVLRGSMAEAEVELRAGPAGDRIRALEGAWLSEHLAKEPARMKKVKERQEPARLKKDGTPSKNWEKWFALSQIPPEESKVWASWNARLDDIVRGRVEDYRWTLSSRQLLADLLYGSSAFGAEVPASLRSAPQWAGLVDWKDGEEPNERKGRPGSIWIIRGPGDEVEVERTDSGGLPADGDVFTLLDPAVGGPLAAYTDAQKELGYVEAFLEHASTDGRVHASWNAPGTTSLRLAGREPNFQQVPKSIELLDAFVPDKGCDWIEADAAALEPHVLAEVSRDPALMELYGPDAKPHDLYLYNAADYAVLRDTVRALYPDGSPGRPVTKEAVAAVKKACKDERGTAKTVTLASNYGAGWRKIFRTLRLEGKAVTEDQAKEIVSSHREKYYASGEGLREQLDAEWLSNGGFVLSPHGFPVAVAEKYRKDLVNRIIQRGGHDCHVIALYYLWSELRARNVDAVGIVWDFHDQWIFSVPSEQAEAALDACRASTEALNLHLDGVVRIKYGPRIVHSLSAAKMEEAHDARELERQAAANTSKNKEQTA